MSYNPETRHRRSIRLSTWDYRERGAYFVTVCTHERTTLFEDRRFAAIAQKAWFRFVNPEACLEHGDFVMMPNHVHGIIWLPRATAVGAQRQSLSVARDVYPRADIEVDQAISHGAAPLQRPDGAATSVLPGSLGAVVRAYKSFTATRINRVRGMRSAPVWQRNYYERVIRDDRELERAREYGLDNPRKWAEDNHNPANFVAP